MPKQPIQLSMQTLLDVIKALEIDVPIMRFDQDDNGAVTVYLYGGEVKHWPPIATAVVEGNQEPPPPPYVQAMEANPMPHFTPPPVTRTQLSAAKKSQRSKKSQTKPNNGL